MTVEIPKQDLDDLKRDVHEIKTMLAGDLEREGLVHKMRRLFREVAAVKRLAWSAVTVVFLGVVKFAWDYVVGGKTGR